MDTTATETSAKYQLGSDLAVRAMCLVRRVEQTAGVHPRELRRLFEDALDLIQRQAKRVALDAFDQAVMQDDINQSRPPATDAIASADPQPRRVEKYFAFR